MKLDTELLANYLSQENAQIIFPDLQLNAAQIIEQQCYETLRKIQDILRDDTLTDTECFEQIDRIICVFEQIGIDCGNRHDFG